MTTPIYRFHRASIADVNNQLWYSYLADAEAYPLFESASISDPEGLTTRAFSNNPIVTRIRVKNKELRAFRKKSLAAMAGIAFVSVTEHLLRYIKEVQSFREELSPSNVQATKGIAPEDLLSDRLTAWGQEFEPHVRRSIAYLRLRRNQVAHANDEPSAAFASFVRHNGIALTAYWAKMPAKLPELDFEKADGATFTQAESISLINLCKICLTLVDDSVMKSIPFEVLEARAIASFAEENRNLYGSSTKRRYRKFKRYFEMEFGLGLQCNIDLFVETFDKSRHE